jgi:hypothetical protein
MRSDIGETSSLLAVLEGQDGLAEFWDEPDFLESGCTTTKQRTKYIERSSKRQGNVRWFLGFAGILPAMLASRPRNSPVATSVYDLSDVGLGEYRSVASTSRRWEK